MVLIQRFSVITITTNLGNFLKYFLVARKKMENENPDCINLDDIFFLELINLDNENLEFYIFKPVNIWTV